MSTLSLSYSALEEYLEAMKGIFIDNERLKIEPDYRERMGGDYDLQVATLDPGSPNAKLVTAKKIRLGIRSAEPRSLAFRLAQELKVWAGLEHQHIVPLLGFYLSPDFRVAILVSEYMTNGDLKDYIAEKKPSSDQRLRLVRDLTDGLAYLHTRSIPIRHGDLKPGNIIVDSKHHALLSDFGLSKALGMSPMSDFTTGNDPRYTTRYADPEILLGSAALSLSNDVWSWACLTCEVMTDKKPFAHIRSEHRIMLAIVQGEAPADVNQLSLPPQLSSLLVKCWSYSSSQRPDATDCLRTVNDEVSKVDADRTLSDHGYGLQGLADPDRVPGLSEASMPVQPTHPSQPDMWNALAKLDAFFTELFNEWLSDRRRTTKHSQLDWNDVDVYKLFVLVGALGGYRAVSEKGLWHIVGEKMGLPPSRGSVQRSTAETAEQLRNLYQENLTSFEDLWHMSLAENDRDVTFPLPRHLQMLRPDVERLATIETPVMKQPQHPSAAGPLQAMDRSEQRPSVEQAAQQETGLLQAMISSEEDTVKYRASPPSSAPPPNQRALMTSGPTPLPHSQPSLRILEKNEISELHPRDLKLKGVSSNVNTRPNPQNSPPRLITGTMGSQEKEVSFWALPPDLLGASHQDNLQTFVPLIPGLNVPREELIKAQEKASAAVSRYSHHRYELVVNASPEEALLLEREIQQLQTLLKNAVQNLTHFLVLAPEADERESHDVAMIIGILSNQVGILQNKSQEKRFMFELNDLQRYETQLNEFASRVEKLQQEALAMQEQRGPSDHPPGSSAVRTMRQKPASPRPQSVRARPAGVFRVPPWSGNPVRAVPDPKQAQQPITSAIHTPFSLLQVLTGSSVQKPTIQAVVDPVSPPPPISPPVPSHTSSLSLTDSPDAASHPAINSSRVPRKKRSFEDEVADISRLPTPPSSIKRARADHPLGRAYSDTTITSPKTFLKTGCMNYAQDNRSTAASVLAGIDKVTDIFLR